MRLIVKPAGRGNWRTESIDLAGPWVTPMSVRVGQRLDLGGVRFRIAAVLLTQPLEQYHDRITERPATD